MTRRRFLGLLGAGLAAGVLGQWLAALWRPADASIRLCGPDCREPCEWARRYPRAGDYLARANAWPQRISPWRAIS